MLSEKISRKRISRLTSLAFIAAGIAVPLVARADDPADPGPPSVAGNTYGNAAPDLASADLTTGAATASLTIKVPSVRGGLASAIHALRYNSQGGTSEAGESWGLGLPEFHRTRMDNPTLPPTYSDADTFDISGSRLLRICYVGNACPAYETMPSWATGWAYYRMERDAAAPARYFLSADRRTWRIELRSGEIQEYGQPIVAGGTFSSNGLDVDPGSYGPGSTRPTGITRWRLVRQFTTTPTIDNPSNLIAYQWVHLGSTGLAFLTDVFDTPKNGAQDPATNYAHHVHLEWESNGAPTMSHAPIWRIHPDMRLARIDVSSANLSGNGSWEVQRRYYLSYLTTPGYRSYLRAFQMEGRCDKPLTETSTSDGSFVSSVSDACPRQQPVQLEYTPAPEKVYYGTLMSLAGVTPQPPSVALMDINSDGLADIVQGDPSGTVKLWINRTDAQGPSFSADPNGMTGASVPLFQTAPPGTDVAGLGATAIGNYDANGRPSVAYFGPPKIAGQQSPTNPARDVDIRVLTASLNGSQWSWSPPYWAMTLPIGSVQDVQIGKKIVHVPPRISDVSDLNADGIPDPFWYQATQQTQTFASRRVDPWGISPGSANVLPAAEGSFGFTGEHFTSNHGFGGRMHVTGDMDGDGLPDSASLWDGPIFYFPGGGDGYAGCQLGPCTSELAHTTTLGIQMVASDMPADWKPEYSADGHGNVNYVYAVDVNGDRFADIVAINKVQKRIDVWLNIDGTRFQTIRSWLHPEPNSIDNSSTLFGDVDGNGTTDVLIVTPATMTVLAWGPSSDGALYTAFPTPGYLLSDIHSGIGATTHIDYKTTTQLELEASQGHSPWQGAWTDHVSSPVTVVTKVTTSTAVPMPYAKQRVLSYDYRNPAFDSWEQRLVGFEKVRVTARNYSADASPIKEITYRFGNCQHFAGKCDPALARDPTRSYGGTPVREDLLDTLGRLYSTTHYTLTVAEVLAADYQAAVSATDSYVKPHFTYVSQADTYLFDPAKPSGSTTLSVPDIIPQSANNDGTQISGTTISLTIPSGAVHLRARRQVAQLDHALQVSSTDDGCVENCPSGNIDSPITTDESWTDEWSTETGWTWRVKSKVTHAFPRAALVPDGYDRQSRFTYDKDGQLVDAFAQLQGSILVERHHEDPSASVAPAPSTVDGEIRIAHNIYDPQYGNLTATFGPDGQCMGYGYDAVFSHLPTTRTMAGASGSQIACSGGIMSAQFFDRGLEIPTASIGASGGYTSILTYDGFGRLVRAYEPAPDSFIPDTSQLPNVTMEYPPALDPSQNLQWVHTRRLTDRALGRYHDTWTAFDPLADELLTIEQADKGAGDGGDWLVSGLALRDPGNDVTLTTYDPWFYTGNPQQQTIAANSARKVAWSGTYDALGRLTSSTGPGNITLSSTSYHPLLREDADADDFEPNGAHIKQPTVRIYDGHGRVAVAYTNGKNGQSQTAENVSTFFGYLATGELAAVGQRRGQTMEFFGRWLQYDSLGRVVLNAEPNTALNFASDPSDAQAVAAMKAWHYQYDKSGRLIATSDARGCGKNITYDFANRPIAEDYSPCLNTQEPYNTANEVSYVYDAPEAGQTEDYGTSALFLTGKLVATRSRGAHVRYAYDSRGRVTGVAKQIATPSGPFAPHWYRTSSDLDEVGRVLRESTGADVDDLMAGGSSDVFYAYTARGVLGSITSSYAPLLANDVRDELGRPTRTDYGDMADTHAIYNYYSDTERLQSYTLSRDSVPATPASVTAPPDVLREGILASEAYAYDAIGNVNSITDMRVASRWPDGAKPVSRTMQYDDYYRLTQVIYNNSNDAQASPFAAERKANDKRLIPTRALASRVQKQTFDYDWKGNTTEVDDDTGTAFYDRALGAIVNSTATSGLLQVFPHQLQSATHPHGNLAAHYDASGNLIDLLVTNDACNDPDGKCIHRFVYDWDEVGHLAHARRWDYSAAPTTNVFPSVPSTADAAVNIHYAYDDKGTRVLKQATDGQGNSIFNAEIFGSLRLNHAKLQPTGDYERTRSTEAVYLAGGLGRVVYLEDGVEAAATGHQHVLLVLGDRLGSTTTVIDQQTSELVEASSYQAFGAPDTDYRPERWGSFREDYRFTGKEDDYEVGITYFGARYYHQALGRWMSADPATIHALSADLNPYAYVRGRVFNTTDPFGLCEAEKPCYYDSSPIQGDAKGWDDAGKAIGKWFSDAGNDTGKFFSDAAKDISRAWDKAQNLGVQEVHKAGHLTTDVVNAAKLLWNANTPGGMGAAASQWATTNKAIDGNIDYYFNHPDEFAARVAVEFVKEGIKAASVIPLGGAGGGGGPAALGLVTSEGEVFVLSSAGTITQADAAAASSIIMQAQGNAGQGQGAQGSGGGTGKSWTSGGVSRPTVIDPKLNNIMNNMYKPGSSVGNGSTADAIRSELATGQPVGGRFHTIKGRETIQALNNWLAKNPNGSASDIAGANAVLQDLINALAGR